MKFVTYIFNFHGIIKARLNVSIIRKILREPFIEARMQLY